MVPRKHWSYRKALRLEVDSAPPLYDVFRDVGNRHAMPILK
jgi:hypothetical protein